MASNTLPPVVNLYSPVDDHGFESQPQHSPLHDPEDFYRSSPGKLDTMSAGNHQDNAVSPISPADSQAPIMGVGQAQEYPPPPMIATYPPPPTMSAPSTGVVNGEIGAIYPPPMPPQPARQDPYAGATMPMTPLTPGPKTPTFKEEADVDKYDQKVQSYDRKDLAVKLRVRLAKIILRGLNCACRLVFCSLAFKIRLTDLFTALSSLLSLYPHLLYSMPPKIWLLATTSRRGPSQHRNGHRSPSSVLPSCLSSFRCTSCTDTGVADISERRRLLFTGL